MGDIIYRRKRREEYALWFWKYKQRFSCICCGESHPACLHFHHVNPKEKRLEVNRMVRTNYSKKLIIDEIRKCVPMCANCHRRLHYGR